MLVSSKLNRTNKEKHYSRVLERKTTGAIYCNLFEKHVKITNSIIISLEAVAFLQN